MARMIPNLYDESTPDSERLVFDILEKDPHASNWIVLHSLGLAESRKRPYGEIDFVVLIPEFGLVCCEVKGGIVQCIDGIWTTTNRYGIRSNLSRSPFLQAREGMFALTANLTEVLKTAGERFRIIYTCVVIFTDISFNINSPEWKTWEFIDINTLRNRLCQGLKDALWQQSVRLKKEQWRSNATSEYLSRIGEILRPDFETVISLSAQIGRSKEKLIRLTEEQFNILDLLADNPRCLIRGGAGTGKTTIAIEAARRFARKDQSILLLCYNKMLGDYLNMQIRHLKISDHVIAGSYHRLLRSIILKSSENKEFLKYEASYSAKELFELIYPIYGELAIRETNEFYEMLIIDEAQDLCRRGSLQVFDAWLKNGLSSGCWYLFGDFAHQALFSVSSNEEAGNELSKYSKHFVIANLTLNCRNTRNIGRETALLSGFKQAPYRLGQIDGPAVDYYYYNDMLQQIDKLHEICSKLRNQQISLNDICIISSSSFEKSSAYSLKISDCKLENISGDFGKCLKTDTLKFSTVQSFKGLESPIVIFCDIERLESSETQSTLYTGMSRAQSLLILLMHERNRSIVKSALLRQLEELIL